MNLRILRALLVLLLAAAAPGTMLAQLSLQIQSIDTSAFPTIRVQVVTRTGTLLRRDLDSSRVGQFAGSGSSVA